MELKGQHIGGDSLKVLNQIAKKTKPVIAVEVRFRFVVLVTKQLQNSKSKSHLIFQMKKIGIHFVLYLVKPSLKDVVTFVNYLVIYQQLILINAIILERPCKTHALIPLYCHSLKMNPFNKNILYGNSLSMALADFECEIKIDYSRPECDHRISITCYYNSQIEKELIKVQDCDVIVSDFIHPVCNHIYPKPNCAKKRSYEQCPPKCKTRVDHKRPCGCIVYIPCFESISEFNKPSKCISSVQIKRPRCGHTLSMRCFEAQLLKESWEQKNGKSAINGNFNI